MRDIVINVENLSKSYVLSHQGASGVGRYERFGDAILKGASAPFRALRRRPESEPKREIFWALQDISFAIERGDVIGIIGRNGAGKSTLLKILSRITEPTSGRVEIEGRVASLLEVGTGFHAELTGRENIYLNGAILGMSRREIRRKFDEIVAFAEVEKFLDTPVKRYSSGMYVRLAFAIAAHLEPDILIVDEVLAVGDAQFQKKCLGKMQDVSTKEGRTVLFVSHNIAAVETLCKKAIYLKAGQFVGSGPTDLWIAKYLNDARSKPKKQESRHLGPALILDSFEFNPNPVVSGQPLKFNLEIRPITKAHLRDLAILLYSGLGTRVAVLDLRPFGIMNHVLANQPLRIAGTIQSLPLVEGHYSIGLYLNTSDTTDNFMDLVSLDVVAPGNQNHVHFPAAHRGIVELNFSAQIESSGRVGVPT